MTAALLSLLLLPGIVAASSPVQTRLAKKDGRFHLEARADLPAALEEALPVFRDFGAYYVWTLQNINVRRAGRKKDYLIQVDSLLYLPEKKEFKLRMTLNLFFKGKYVLNLAVADRLDEDPPHILVTHPQPSLLVKELEGGIIFTRRTGGGITLDLKGEAKVHWVFYHLVPMGVLRANIEDRVLTVVENAVRRLPKSN